MDFSISVPRQPVRVLQVLPSISATGGAEQSQAMMAPFLMERGIELHLAYFKSVKNDLLNSLKDSGVVVHDLSGSQRVFPRWAIRLRRLIKDIRPDVIHSTLFDADISVRVGALFTGTRLLSTWASTSYDPIRMSLEPGYGGWKRDVVRLCDLLSAHVSRSSFHAVTPGVADDGIRALHVEPERVFVVERGRDLSVFAPRGPAARARARALMGLSPDVTVMVSVGRQVHPKGHVHLLRAFDSIARDRPDLCLVLIGADGSASATIRSELETLDNRARVVLLGHRDDVSELLCGCDVFVLSSIAEGAAGSVLEAMAAGVPVVSTRVKGLQGIIEDEENAVLAEPGDSTSLGAAMVRVLDDLPAAAARAERARTLVEQRYSLERCADNMTEMYQRVAAG